MRAHIACHIQHKRLKTYQYCKLRHNVFKQADHAGDDHAKPKQNNEPWQALFNAGFDRFLNVFFRGKAAELCVILSHRLVHDLNNILRCDHAQKPVSVIQNGNGIFRIVLQSVYAVIRFLICVNIGVGSQDNIVQNRVLPRNDQIFQIDRAVKFLFLIHHVNGGNIIILGSLGYKLGHSGFDADPRLNLNEIRGHFAADLVFSKRGNQKHVFFAVVIH